MQTPTDLRPTAARRAAVATANTLLAVATLGGAANAFAANAAGGDITRQADATGLWFVVLMLLFIATLIGGFWMHGRGDAVALPAARAATPSTLPPRA